MIRLLVAAEDGLGHRLACHLADRLCLELEWIDDGSLDSHREWCDYYGQPFLLLSRVRDLAKKMGIRPRGKFDDQPGAPDALQFRKLFLVVAEMGLDVDLLLVARDVDRTDRRTGFAQARKEMQDGPFAIVGALAEPEAEAWLVCAHRPEGESEARALRELRSELGFDPIAKSHQLTSTSGSRKDAKTVLIALAGSTEVAEDRFRRVPLRDLLVVGAKNGLAIFLSELRPEVHRRLGVG